MDNLNVNIYKQNDIIKSFRHYKQQSYVISLNELDLCQSTDLYSYCFDISKNEYQVYYMSSSICDCLYLEVHSYSEMFKTPLVYKKEDFHQITIDDLISNISLLRYVVNEFNNEFLNKRRLTVCNLFNMALFNL